jgi:hypothetical protein
MAKATKKGTGKAAIPVKPGGTDGGIEDISHEEIPIGNSNITARALPHGITPAEVPIETTIQLEISRFNVADAAIARLQEAYGSLKINDPSDREGYRKVQAAWREIKGLRIQVEKKHKEIKADYLAISKAIDGEKNRLVDLLKPLEDLLGGELERIDKIVEDQKKEEERLEQEKLNQRIHSIIDAGANFDGSFYCIAEISVDVVTVKSLPDAEFERLLGRIREESHKIKEAKRLEEERIQKEKDDFFAAQQLQEAERQRLEEERLAMEKERAEARIEVLHGLGFSFVRHPDRYALSSEAGELHVFQGEIQTLSSTDWTNRVNSIRENIGFLRAKEKEIQAKAHQDQQRRQCFYDLGFRRVNNQFVIETVTFGYTNFIKDEDFYDLDEESFQQLLQYAKESAEQTRRQDQEERERAKQQEEIIRQASLSDVQKVREYMNRVITAGTTNTPKLESGPILNAFVDYQNAISEAEDVLLEFLTTFDPVEENEDENQDTLPAPAQPTENQ